MTGYLIRRLIAAVPTLIVVSILVAGLIRLQPGDAIMAQLEEGGLLDEEDLIRIRAELGIDRPFPVQYWDWINGVVVGDFGNSLQNNRDVLTQIGKRSRVSIQLAIMAMAVAIVIAIPLGVISSVKQDSWVDYVARLFSIGGLSVPDYFIATILLWLLSVKVGWLPEIRYYAPWDEPAKNLQLLIFPALIVGYRLSAISARMTRSAMLEVLRQDYIRTARSKGLTERVVILRHSLRNALIPVVTIMGSQFSFLLGGVVIIEIVFSLPGIGTLLLNAVDTRDYPVVQGVVIITSLVHITANLFVDLSYAVIDPRIRYS